MKKYMLFFSMFISLFSYSMQNHISTVLLLESAECAYNRNAREVERYCLDFLNYCQKKEPHLVVTEEIKQVLRAMGQAQMTTEEKKAALHGLAILKMDIKNKRKREKEKEAEDREILAQFGWVNVDGRDRTKIQKIRRIN